MSERSHWNSTFYSLLFVFATLFEKVCVDISCFGDGKPLPAYQGLSVPFSRDVKVFCFPWDLGSNWVVLMSYGGLKQPHIQMSDRWSVKPTHSDQGENQRQLSVKVNFTSREVDWSDHCELLPLRRHFSADHINSPTLFRALRRPPLPPPPPTPLPPEVPRVQTWVLAFYDVCIAQ